PTPKTGQSTGGSMSDVIVVGGGVMGLLTARALLVRGMTVTLIDKSETGSEASWAGGGIVSPLYPWNYVPAISALASWAQDYYPELVAQLRDETGIDPELNPCGLLMLDPPEAQQALDWGRRFGKTVQAVDHNFVHQREPAATRDFSDALWLPYVGNVRNPRLLQALRASLLSHARFSLVVNQAVTDIVADDASATVCSNGGRWTADKVVVCAGAWSTT